jgi:short subunit dehydrogenase-like uncharacterized protein
LSERAYDIVVFGATGFTGELVARYLAKWIPGGRRWAIAGRSAERLEAIRQSLLSERPACGVGIVIADLEQPASLLEMARQTRVVLTTVGPYSEYGEAVLRASVEGGAHHLDITGEPDFIELARERYHEAALAKKLCIVHACGFGSLPPDAGAFFTAQQLPAQSEKSVRAYIDTNARPSGGTVRSILRGAAKGRLSLLRELTKPVGEPDRLPRLKARIHRIRELGAWAVPTPVVDSWMVGQSVHARSKAYGPNFQYSQYLVLRHFAVVCLVLILAGLLVVAAKLPPTRLLLERLFAQPGGPSPEERSRTHFAITFIADSSSTRVVTRVSGGDPGYDECSKMLAECGILLVDDAEPPAVFGVQSPIAVFGNRLIQRLQERDMRFEVIDLPRAS